MTSSPSDPATTPAGALDTALAARVRAGDRAALGRAITLVESRRADDRAEAEALLAVLMPDTGHAFRVGVTGAPGVGKSTFIERLGTRLTARGHRVAVLAVDPSSSVSGGSILGDKTRMAQLAADPRAFVRPSPSGGALGGVGDRTREAILVCEAAGYDVVLVETVGVGQSESRVAGMVDFFLLLVQPGAGDELQGIKRGVVELADLVAVTKADGEGAARAAATRADYGRALHLLRPKPSGWVARVVACSGLDGSGVDAVWSEIVRHRATLAASGALAAARSEQGRAWMWSLIDAGLRAELARHAGAAAAIEAMERDVVAGRVTPAAAAARVLAAFGSGQATR